ncbi:MAG: bacteriohemerythrin [Candidatus Omnitrophota bacterium]
MIFEWRKAYNVDVPLMDEQHHKLVDILNRLNTYIKDGAPAKQSWSALVDELSDYTKYHFLAEEKLMRENDYQGFREHAAEHSFFIERIENFRKGFQSNDLNVVDELLYFLMIWLQNHILIVDHKLAGFLKPVLSGSQK